MAKWKGKQVAVLFGGLSAEREVSLKTGSAVQNALASLGYDPVGIDVGRDLPARLVDNKIDVAFVALHGKYGEDGAVQGVLEVMGIPYTGSGVASSALSMDKISSKRVFVQAGLPTPDYRLASREDDNEFTGKCVVKPATTGSTFGITIVEDAAALEPAIVAARKYDDNVFIEQYIEGAEVTCALMGGGTFPPIEIVPPEGFYDYDAKYTYAKGKTEYLIPARIGAAAIEEVQAVAQKAWDILGCDGYARADFIVESGGQVWLLEMNTIPGLTETSLVPKAAAHVGISFPELVEQILDSASLKLAEGA